MAAPLSRSDGFVAPCIPSLAHKPASGPDWVHEIKHDGYRLIVRRDGKAVRYPAIASLAAKLRAKSFTMDGEAAVSGADGIPRAVRRRAACCRSAIFWFCSFTARAEACFLRVPDRERPFLAAFAFELEAQLRPINGHMTILRVVRPCCRSA
jgi:hypothetical protein